MVCITPNPERLTGRLRAVLAAERMSVVAGEMLLPTRVRNGR